MSRESFAVPVRIFCGVGGLLGMGLCLASPTLLLTTTAIGIGWFRHLLRMPGRMGIVLVAVAVVAIFVVLLTRMGDEGEPSGEGDASREPEEQPRRARKRVRARLARAGAGLLAITAALAFIGMAQQASKLLRSPRSLSVVRPGYNAFNTSRNNLKQIGLAAHNYESRFKVFPGAGTFSDVGEGRHSWMTLLLPYIDQAELYRRIDLASPWTSPANVEHFRQPVACYADPSDRESPKPPEDGVPRAGYAGNIRLFPPDRSLAIRQITDGTSNTILAGEVAAGRRAWGDPANLRDPARGINHLTDGFGGPWSHSTQILMGDGAVRRVPREIDPEVLRRLGTPNGGEEVDLLTW